MMNRPFVATAAAPATSDWRALASAPKTGRAVLLLIREASGLVAAVGRYEKGGWRVRLPYSDAAVEVFPQRWFPVPNIRSS
jgi:hypothetical protein